MSNVTESFGSMVFSDADMRERLPRQTYRELQSCVQRGGRLTPEVAAVIANVMKDWAIEKGATHFTHWFQPMTGITAEKHDGFLSPAADGRAVAEFGGKELIQGEPDASSFPSGGLRATFEARGYTAWDPTSPAFVKDGVLCIPTAFCSYGGQALDKKTPLLRSMEALSAQAVRLLRLFGRSDVSSVRPMAGAEQEYFLVDKSVFERRKDLIYTGRTLIGARPPKGQELDDHYFGAIKPRVSAFMKELDAELWKLGVPAKTEHNEAAPGQHELASVYTTVNIAADQNQLVMELMRRTAAHYDMVCLLHEKPFAGVNGSGKHNNWSLCTDGGENLFEPGETPSRNAQFLTFLCAVLKGVNDYQELLRAAVASAGNDHRLGANEAPPAILSVYLGSELTEVLDAIEADSEYAKGAVEQFKLGADVLPRFPKDATDRNRTSPFAFTGNKFEFRMVGASQSISDANISLNAIMAEELRQFADRLEAAEDFAAELHDLLRETVSENKRIIFNGNGYDEAWIREAQRRGLANLRTTPDALSRYLMPKNIELFRRTGVLGEDELRARCDIIHEGYAKMVKIEALTMVDMVMKDVLPAVSVYTGRLARRASEKKNAGVAAGYESDCAMRLSGLLDEAYRGVNALNDAISALAECAAPEALSAACRDEVLTRMNGLRVTVDTMETMTDASVWPYPTYGEMLFSVR